MLFGAIISIIVLLLGIGMYMDSAKDNQFKLIQEVMTNEAHNLEIQFEELLDEKVMILRALTSYPDIYKMDEARQRKFIAQRSYRFGFSHIFVMNTDGIGYYMEENVHRDQSEEQFFRDVMDNDVFITEPFYTEDGVVFTTICVPIYNEKTEKVGSLCGALRLTRIQSLISENKIVLDGQCFILDKEGKYLTSQEGSDVVYQISIFDKKDSEVSLVKKALEEKKDQKGTITIEVIEYQSNITYLEDYNWIIVQNIPTSAIGARFTTLNALQIGLGICVFVLICCIIRIIYCWYLNINRIYKDPLTRCSSRAACLDLIDNINKKYTSRITFLYMDLNNFKYVNDTYGHNKGDELLCIFGEAIGDIFGKIGFVGRMGGDEFISVLLDTSDAEVEALWKELEVRLVEKSVKLGIDYIITSSYGYVSREKGETESLENLMHRADEKMYAYKFETKSLQ